jgi:hypothetical protein
MFTNEVGELKHSSFHVQFSPPMSRAGRVDAILQGLGAEYAGPHGTDAVHLSFDCGTWFGEAYLDRDQAGRLLDRLSAAIAEYDRREPMRRDNPTTHHLFDEADVARSRPEPDTPIN